MSFNYVDIFINLLYKSFNYADIFINLLYKSFDYVDVFISYQILKLKLKASFSIESFWSHYVDLRENKKFSNINMLTASSSERKKTLHERRYFVYDKLSLMMKLQFWRFGNYTALSRDGQIRSLYYVNMLTVSSAEG